MEYACTSLFDRPRTPCEPLEGQLSECGAPSGTCRMSAHRVISVKPFRSTSGGRDEKPAADSYGVEEGLGRDPEKESSSGRACRCNVVYCLQEAVLLFLYGPEDDPSTSPVQRETYESPAPRTTVEPLACRLFTGYSGRGRLDVRRFEPSEHHMCTINWALARSSKSRASRLAQGLNPWSDVRVSAMLGTYDSSELQASNCSFRDVPCDVHVM